MDVLYIDASNQAYVVGFVFCTIMIRIITTIILDGVESSKYTYSIPEHSARLLYAVIEW